jgi:hypothetical protein
MFRKIYASPKEPHHEAIIDLIIKRIDQLLLPRYIIPEQNYEREIKHLYNIFSSIENETLRGHTLTMIMILKETTLPINARGQIINSLREALGQVSHLRCGYYLLSTQNNASFARPTFPE